MSELSLFLKENTRKRENVKYAATRMLVDESGKPLEWVIRPITTTENDKLRDESTTEVQVVGKPGQFRPKIDTTKYMAKLIAKSVAEPNLYDKTLQDSYGVMTPEDLVREMVDDPGEYSALAQFIQEFNGFTDINEKVERAKN